MVQGDLMAHDKTTYEIYPPQIEESWVGNPVSTGTVFEQEDHTFFVNGICSIAMFDYLEGMKIHAAQRDDKEGFSHCPTTIQSQLILGRFMPPMFSKRMDIHTHTHIKQYQL